jgi:Na+-translocating ferredoxin:NAD+ oxidoreductase RnfC subunit
MKGKVQYSGTMLNQAHKLIEYRKTPIKKIMQKLHLNRFPNRGPLIDYDWKPEQLEVMLRQHIGTPAEPVVAVNDRVKEKQKIASVGGNLGAEIHSPLAGRVASITSEHILIEVDHE